MDYNFLTLAYFFDNADEETLAKVASNVLLPNLIHYSNKPEFKLLQTQAIKFVLKTSEKITESEEFLKSSWEDVQALCMLLSSHEKEDLGRLVLKIIITWCNYDLVNRTDYQIDWIQNNYSFQKKEPQAEGCDESSIVPSTDSSPIRKRPRSSFKSSIKKVKAISSSPVKEFIPSVCELKESSDVDTDEEEYYSGQVRMKRQRASTSLNDPIRNQKIALGIEIYFAQYRTCDVPSRFVVTSADAPDIWPAEIDGFTLGSYVHCARRRQDKLTAENMELLNNAGMSWKL